ncbi:MAG: class I SAM-dependent methyltransferase [Desulfuromonadaceae bacterium]|nr:class I SAM-dependent methyltransferase [Desulfuromonadaceae bacterium]
MYGLFLSYFLWPNHYAILDFFIQKSRNIKSIKNYLEIGPGHGLYLSQARRLFSEAQFTALDISPTSLEISKDIYIFFTDTGSCDFVIGDLYNVKSRDYDYIVMCEVLEHLDDPVSALKQVRSLLVSDGYVFVTTCANCPAIDHVYHYKSVEHIREQIMTCGFKILSDLALSVDKIPPEKWTAKQAEINYAALLMAT